MQTTVGVNDAKAVKRWANTLAVDTEKEMYFSRFIGKGQNNIIERKVELEEDAGDRVQFDLRMRLRGGMTFGDNNIVGKEEGLNFYSDEVKIDQARKGVSGGGRMTRKRTLHNLRQLAKDAETEYMAEWMDEIFFVYLSGDSAFAAINQDAKVTEPFAGNAVTAPDADHILYGGAAVSKATLTATDKMSIALLERVAVKPRMMNAVNPDVVKMNPVTVEGAKRFIVLMSPFQEHGLRTDTTNDLSWPKIQQALATAEGRNSPICKGGMGLINNLVLHSHENVRRFSDYGAGSNVSAARALLLGRQAGVVAHGSAGKGTRYSWHEETTNAGNDVAIYAGTICGVKKTTFNGYDFGVCAIDTACKDPNVA